MTVMLLQICTELNRGARLNVVSVQLPFDLSYDTNILILTPKREHLIKALFPPHLPKCRLKKNPPWTNIWSVTESVVYDVTTQQQMQNNWDLFFNISIKKMTKLKKKCLCSHSTVCLGIGNRMCHFNAIVKMPYLYKLYHVIKFDMLIVYI